MYGARNRGIIGIESFKHQSNLNEMLFFFRFFIIKCSSTFDSWINEAAIQLEKPPMRANRRIRFILLLSPFFDLKVNIILIWRRKTMIYLKSLENKNNAWFQKKVLRMRWKLNECYRRCTHKGHLIYLYNPHTVPLSWSHPHPRLACAALSLAESAIEWFNLSLC